jgi:glyoxylase-like metal-dependent hydrolase (beta-lactamase superfamily II)
LSEPPSKVAKGLYQIRLPIPIQSLGSVFVYFAHDGHDNLLIDTGWNTEEAYQALEAALYEIGFSVRDLKKVLISHLHPDHFGLADRIKKESPDCILMMHRRDAEDLLGGARDRQGFLSALEKFLKENGATSEILQEMMSPTSSWARFSIPGKKPDLLLAGGENIKLGKRFDFEIISTPGHTKGSVCALDHRSKIFFSGDTVLPTITPNVSLNPLYNDDPLGDYLESLESLKVIRPANVLPSHEHVFENLTKRIGEIEKHHSERLNDTVMVLSQKRKPASGYEIASKLHWYAGSWEKLSAWEKRAAEMETLAHLEYLRRRKRIVRIEEGLSSDPRVFYSLLSQLRAETARKQS